MIYYRDKKLTKDCMSWEADIIMITKKHWLGLCHSKDAIFKGGVPNDRHCAWSQ